MKRFTKICLIICAVLAGTGMILAGIGGVLGFGYRQMRNMVENGYFSWAEPELDWDLHMEENIEETLEEGVLEKETVTEAGSLTEENIETEAGSLTEENTGGEGDSTKDWMYGSEEWNAEEIKELEVNFHFGSVEIAASENDKIGVQVQYRDVWGAYNRNIQWVLQGGSLEIMDKVDKEIMKSFPHGVEDASLVIYIPKGKKFQDISLEIGTAEMYLNTSLEAAEMEISLGAGTMRQGDVEENECIIAEELSLDIGAGHMLLDGIRVRNLEADCGAGELSIYCGEVERAEIDCGVGTISMELTGKEQDYDYKVACGIGEVVVGNASYSGLGSGKYIKNGGKKYMDIDCGIGKVNVQMTGKEHHP